MKQKKSSTERKKILGIMKKHCDHAYLATVAGKQPWIRSVSAIIGDDMSIWVATSARSRKVKQIMENPRACLHFAKYPDGSMIATVQGKMKVVKGLKEKKRAWKLARYDMKQFFPDGPGSRDYCLLRLVPGVVEWWASWQSGRQVTRF